MIQFYFSIILAFISGGLMYTSCDDIYFSTSLFVGLAAIVIAVARPDQ